MGHDVIDAPLTALDTVTQMVGEPRYASLKGIMGARTKEIATVGLDETGLHWAVLGDDAATTGVLRARAPALYLALGVSEALQHRVGIQTADTIVAVNRDPDAPLAAYADLYVAGDLFEVGPALAADLRSRQG